MNGTTDTHNDDSSWDMLASELGLEPAPPPKAKPVPPPAPPTPVPTPAAKIVKPEPEPEPEFFGEIVEVVAAPVPEVEITPHSIQEEPIGATTEDTVIDDAAAEDDAAAGEESTTEEGAEGTGTGRRRRRRRRKKGGGKPETAEAPVEMAREVKVAEVVAAPIALHVEDDEPAEIVGEAADELEDDDEEDAGGRPATLDEELEDDSTEPLPEWKVVAWTDLIATLYRPQDR